MPSEKRSKVDARSTLCRLLGYSDHEKAYRLEGLSSRRILVSRDAQFMEDNFDSGKHKQVGSEEVDLCDADEATVSEDVDDRDDEDSDEGMDERAVETVSTNDWLQWKQRQSSTRHPR